MKKEHLVVFLFLLYTLPVQAQQTNNGVHINNGIERPKIVIGLVVDQMRWDYLYRYYDRYSEGGFKKLLQRGFSFENAFIPYTPSVTAAGHTCIFTGSVPALHGIVGNDWVERIDGTIMYCTRDYGVTGVGSNNIQGQMSPKNMLTTTIGDELRLASNFKSRVYGIALKDRGGIVAAGRSANAAYWFDDSTGNWISSTWYMQQLPLWVSAMNSSRVIDTIMKQDWNLLYNRSIYDQSTLDDKVFEKTLQYETNRTFPHSYKNMIGKSYFDFRVSPYSNTYTLDFASKLIYNEKLGSTGQTDMLCISLSSTDYIGHRFGPNSMEIEDTYLRLDKDIANFLSYLDKTFGKYGYLFFLSADHGAPQVPDFMKENKMNGGHLNGFYGIRDSLNKVGLQKFGAGNIVKRVYEYQVYLDNDVIAKHKLNSHDIKKEFIQYLEKQPEVLSVFDYDDFSNVVLPAKIKEMLAKGYYHNRSGDMQLILKANHTDVNSMGTEHGTIYNYDTHIPLVWYGWKIPQGKTNREVYMTDIAPTISAMLHIQMPNGSVGTVLPEIVK